LTTLAKAFEQEYAAKAEEQVEIERVLRKRTAEIDYLQKQLEVLMPHEQAMNSAAALEQDAQDEKELAALEREAEAWVELDQAADLRNLIAMAPPQQQQQNGGSDPKVWELKLQESMRERHRLVRTVVQAMGNAGMGQRQEGYKRLIRGAMGVKESEIEGIIDEVLRELLEDARERGMGEGSAIVA
jgi:hypothetical protein